MMRKIAIDHELTTRATPAKQIASILGIHLCLMWCTCFGVPVSLARQAVLPPAVNQSREPASAMFAGGCFWSMESDFEHCPGVVDVVSGYSGGRSKNPTYETYEAGGHREVVTVFYDPSKVTYAGLVEYFIKHIDPFDRGGTFIDRGKQYSPAIYVANEDEEKVAKEVMKAIDGLKVFNKPLKLPVLKVSEFYPAEEYHQNYHVTHVGNYGRYRATCGRDDFVMQYWGQRASIWLLPGSVPAADGAATQEPALDDQASMETKGAQENQDIPNRPWESFKKPKASELKKRLTKLQFRVTQADDTEPAFANTFWNHHATGIYVDVVSGEPLFASYDKFDSGTGWPSFVVPLVKEYIEYHPDSKEAQPRIEVRSKFGQSHLGHVFEDGPRERGGMRYCINSAALRFVPVEKMDESGYGEFLERFRQPQPNPAADRKGGQQ